MIYPGLVSITFRKLPPAEIVRLVREAGLHGIEWGGDIHAPHGDLERAQQVRKLTEEAGLKTVAYGSYYTTGISEEEGLSFVKVLASAETLQAPTIRVWAGKIGSADIPAEQRQKIISDLKRLCDLAAAKGMTISTEFHRKTLTDTNASALQLIQEVNHPAFRTYWQPPIDQNDEQCVEGLKGVLPKLTHLHVYQWKLGTTERGLLSDGESRWNRFMSLAASSGRDHSALIEFVKGNDPANFLKDGATLKKWAGVATLKKWAGVF